MHAGQMAVNLTCFSTLNRAGLRGAASDGRGVAVANKDANDPTRKQVCADVRRVRSGMKGGSSMTPQSPDEGGDRINC